MTERRIRPVAVQSPDQTSAPSTIEALVEAAVERAISRVSEPHLRRLQSCSPAVYTVSQAAEVLQVSDDTIGRLVRKGVLPRVPHLDGKVLIPRDAVSRLLDGQVDQRSEPSRPAAAKIPADREAG